MIAERGPGQLVGERGALQVNVRSANVIALGTVHALVMKTEDFASFIDAHPRVLQIVEGQIYDRLIERSHRRPSCPLDCRPAQSGRAGRLPGSVPTSRAGRGAAVAPAGGGELHRGPYGRGGVRRARPQRSRSPDYQAVASEQMVRVSLGRVWGECVSEDRGDGLLIVVPPHIPTAHVMGRCCTGSCRGNCGGITAPIVSWRASGYGWPLMWGRSSATRWECRARRSSGLPGSSRRRSSKRPWQNWPVPHSELSPRSLFTRTPFGRPKDS